MPFREPEYEGEIPSLGWLLLGWIRDYLPSPADETKPLIFTDEQATLFVRWYRLDPDDGSFVYRRGCCEMAKGWGKSPFEAAKALAEFAGPVLFDGWDAQGEPVGRPWGTKGSPPPWVQIAAVSEDQTDNTYVALYEMLTANDGKAAKDLGIDQGRTRLYLTGGRPGRLEPVTAEAGSREGQRVTYAVLDETHLWTPSNGGRRLAATLRRNVAKMDGRTFETTNAPVLGEHSVAEQTGKDAQAHEPGILYYSKRPASPQPDATDEQLLDALGTAYGDAWWVDLPRLIQEIRDPQTAWTDSLRYYFNIPVQTADQWLPVGAWNKRAAPRALGGRPKVALAFSGSVDGKDAGLWASTPDGYVFAVKGWEAPEGGTVDRADVNATVLQAKKDYEVLKFGVNPPGWETDAEAWAETYGSVLLGWEVRKVVQFTAACGKFYNAVVTGRLHHDGNRQLERHLENAHPKRIAGGEGTYILDNGDRSCTIAKAAVIAFHLAFEQADRQPLMAWV